MSRHHRAQRWSTHAPRLRAQIAVLVEQGRARCIECGRPVTPDQKWHAGHVTAAAAGGEPTSGNVGPVHASCNLRAGGRAGAAVTNGRRHTTNGLRPW